MPPRDDLRARVDAVEEAYEFFLAFATERVSDDRASGSGGRLRELLGRAAAALDDIADCAAAVVRDEDLRPADAWTDMIDVLDSDAAGAAAAVRLVMSQDFISSRLVDNLNANIHLRALLTDLFLLAEALP